MNSFIEDLSQAAINPKYDGIAITAGMAIYQDWLVDLSDEELEARLNKGSAPGGSTSGGC